MEKLIKLFNKRAREKRLIYNDREDLNENEVFQNLLYLKNLKSFCKWLCDNDKVNWECVVQYDIKNEGTEVSRGAVNQDKSLVAVLSIQEYPIRFLINLLK